MKTESIESVHRLAPLQQGMLFHSLYAPDSGIYVQQLVCRLHHELDVAAFERAWQQVIARHEVFRTSFRWEGLDYPVQEVHRHVGVSLNVVDRASLSPAEQTAELDRFLDDDRRRGFSFRRRATSTLRPSR